MSGIVVDLGCERHGKDYSIEPLVERFKPEVLHGFDPAMKPDTYVIDETMVVISNKAAWVNDGTIELSRDDDKATTMSTSSVWGEWRRQVRCFDFSAWLERFTDQKVVVKMDIEGAEVPILEHVVEDSLDERISLLIVEWHDQFFGPMYASRRKKLEDALRCPVEVWP